MAGMAPAPGGAPMVPSRKISPIVWVIAGVAGFFLLIGVLIVAGGLFLASKIADNPMLAAAAAIAAANPDVEIVSNDTAKGTVTFREKSSGKTLTLNFDQIKQGRLVFSGDGKEVTVETGAAGVHLKSSDGTVADIGAGSGALPEWIPAYPGVKIEGAFSSSSEAEKSASLTFTTRDATSKILKFYTDGFKDAGMKLSNVSEQDGGGMLSAESSDGKRHAAITVSSASGEAHVGITFTAKR